MPFKLTKRQLQIYRIIEDYLNRYGYSPTLSEVMEETGITTKKGVAFHLDALEKKGVISRTGGARGIRLKSNSEGDFVRVPLLGFANAGEPLARPNEEFLGELYVDSNIIRSDSDIYTLELRGDSMDQMSIGEAFMLNGNYILVQKTSAMKDGDVVVAMINDGVTVKILTTHDKTIVLRPCSSNPIHKPIYMHEDTDCFLGKVVAVLHNPMLN